MDMIAFEKKDVAVAEVIVVVVGSCRRAGSSSSSRRSSSCCSRRSSSSISRRSSSCSCSCFVQQDMSLAHVQEKIFCTASNEVRCDSSELRFSGLLAKGRAAQAFGEQLYGG